ncbi:uncharacterized protein [Porites lutea]|uniref:uncharacterized protein n=1 Tax=Porites lutea TaxID=51062 RepID=UPI003CC56C5C
MAARSIFRAVSLCRRNIVFIAGSSRAQSIFTKYREPPNGFLFNEKPLKPGEKRQWEEWEEPWYRWWALILVVIPVMFYYKPDTKPQTWARKQALRIVAERDAAYEAAAARGEVVEEEEAGDVVINWKPLM